MPIDYNKYPKDWKEIRERILKRLKINASVVS